MSRLDGIAFEVAKRLLSRGTQNAAVDDNCPVLLDLAAMVKEVMLHSGHRLAQCPTALWNERVWTAGLQLLSPGTGQRANTGQ